MANKSPKKQAKGKKLSIKERKAKKKAKKDAGKADVMAAARPVKSG